MHFDDGMPMIATPSDAPGWMRSSKVLPHWEQTLPRFVEVSNPCSRMTGDAYHPLDRCGGVSVWTVRHITPDAAVASPVKPLPAI
jgi:hypothetical protein